jgi:hypothetical protein
LGPEGKPRFQPDRALLYYYNGTAWSAPVNNTGVTTATGTRYSVRVETVADRVRVWRSEGSGMETLVFDQTAMPVYDGNRLQFIVSANTVASLDDILVLADDSGLNRTAAFTVATNNELAMTSDYNGSNTFAYDAWGRT